MKHRAAALACALCLAPVAEARAGSVNDPGFTTGVPVYGDFPQGLYLGLFPQYGVRSGSPRTDVAIYSAFFFYESPLKILGANIAQALAPIYVDERVKGQFHAGGFYNTYAGTQFTWQLPHDWGVGFRVSSFLPESSAVSYHFGTVELRGGATYLSNMADFTLNLIQGHPVEGSVRTAPDYTDLDLTYSHNIGHWQVGMVGFGSMDDNRPYRGYARQAQFAAGPLVGYDFGRVLLQFRFTADVAQNNMGGYDRRIWGGLTFPLWTPHVAASAPIEKKP